MKIESDIPMPASSNTGLRAKYAPVIDAMKSGQSVWFSSRWEANQFRSVAYALRVFFVSKAEGGGVRLWRK